jgi:(1->4)-alpha-D-glucan 1-alpha-D-glucosylmutase
LRRYPLSSYRVQINGEFNLAAAASCVSYLKALGIDCLYTSPYLQAAAGSTHGYDTVDYSTVNREWGGNEGEARLVEQLRLHGMGQIVDIVPNHMAFGGRANPWWWDVLENGPSSAYASFFDVDWDPPERAVSNKVLLHVLGDHYGAVLDRGELKLSRSGTEILVQYGDNYFPIAPRSIALLLRRIDKGDDLDKVAFLADALAELPAPSSLEFNAVQRRHRDRKILLAMLAAMIAQDPGLAQQIDITLALVNADHSALHDFLESQNYRLANWRIASRDLGYRRFFDINTLIGLRMEDDRVFAAAHSLIRRWIAEGVVCGIRVDHPDGLRDPTEYLGRLRASSPDAWIVAEKILGTDENLPDAWPIEGTTGYDFLNIAGGLFIDCAAETPMSEIYREFTGENDDFESVAMAGKLSVLQESLGGDLNRLTAMFYNVCSEDRLYRDYTRRDAEEVLRTTLICMNVYRTYVRQNDKPDAESAARIASAIEKAKATRQDLDYRLFDLLQSILLMRRSEPYAIDLALRFQQTGAAVMAKGVEDTAFYRFNRFIALNEVGGDPAQFGHTIDYFHTWCARKATHWPLGMLTTSTHDSKRSEDVRARLSVLTEIPDRWKVAIGRWSSRNQTHRSDELPDPNMEYHLYQTLLGAWPLDEQRLMAYASKAAREAKAWTSWSQPNEKYEAALKGFVEGMMRDAVFLEDLSGFVADIADAGRTNSLALTLLKLTVPGIPDFYQATEIWSLNLVDPDNRQAVDYDLRRRLLEDLCSASTEEIMRHSDEGLPKLWLIRQGLALRNSHPKWFGAESSYIPIESSGEYASNVIAFARGESMVSVAPRLMFGKDWGDTTLRLPSGYWHNCLTGERLRGGTVRVNQLLQRFPVALLTKEDVRQ